jgi:hypothetical protein
MPPRIYHRYNMVLWSTCISLSILAVWGAGGCAGDSAAETAPSLSHNAVSLTFQLDLNREVYEDSAWGDPPQMAIWLRNETDGSVRTVAVTHRTAACDWEGKVECSVALPYWVGFHNQETGTQGPPTWDRPAADAITCATPRAAMTVCTDVPYGTQWEYFVEVNVSGDFNTSFPRLSADGRPDRYGNGQPSLVYRGRIEAMEGRTSHPELTGRTDQYEPTQNLIEDTGGITNAGQLVDSFVVSCQKNKEFSKVQE